MYFIWFWQSHSLLPIYSSCIELIHLELYFFQFFKELLQLNFIEIDFVWIINYSLCLYVFAIRMHIVLQIECEFNEGSSYVFLYGVSGVGRGAGVVEDDVAGFLDLWLV